MKYSINKDHPSANQDHRIRFLVLHTTFGGFAGALDTLTTRAGGVSAHYLIPKQGDEIYQLVEEPERAWHAGHSQWQNVNQLNYSSIGIEIVSLGYQVDKHGKPIRDKHGSRIWYPFEEQQIDLIIALAKDIVQRYNILSTRVVGHSDIAPGRKSDPGALFPWKKLHDHGIGAWPNPEDVQEIKKDLPAYMAIASLQEDFKKYGYDVAETGVLDAQTKNVVTAFHMHFMGTESPIPDQQTHATIKALLKKYAH